MIGAVIGAVGTWAVLANAGSRGDKRERSRDVERLPMCNISLVLVAADDSAVAQAIDWRTGGHGFSHAYLDGCRIDRATGRRVVIDYTAGRGLHWTDASAYARRGAAVVEFAGELGAEIYGCVASKLGAPFKVAPLLAGVESEHTCAGLIVHCLPPALRRSLREAAGHRCVSPNDLAVYFGAELGQRVRVAGRDGTERA